MKEVTYEDWQKNPTPRAMWVWDDEKKYAIPRKVIYFIENKDTSFPVVALSYDGTITANYRHCAEIEEPKTRRMTNKELSWWLSEKPHRERKFARAPYIYTYYTYDENEQDEEVSDNFLIRENGGEWREPLVEGEKPMFVSRCKKFETCESVKNKGCRGCNVWNYLYDIKALQKWCEGHNKDFMQFTMEMHRHLKEQEK